MKNKQLLPAQAEDLLSVLKTRFEKHQDRHPGLKWSDVHQRLIAHPEKLWSLDEMEVTGGEPDVVAYDSDADQYVFFDCSPESPKERRSLCYDAKALASRKEHKPRTSAVEMAAEMGIEVLTEAQYFELQQLGKFDTKTSSWLRTDDAVRGTGGAIFGDFRYGRTFIYHNGAESYYAARGFRGVLRV